MDKASKPLRGAPSSRTACMPLIQSPRAQLPSRVPPIQTLRPLRSRVPIQVPRIQTACRPPAPEISRAVCQPSKLHGPPPCATHPGPQLPSYPNSAGSQLPSRVPPIPPGAFLFLLRRGPQQFLFGEKPCVTQAFGSPCNARYSLNMCPQATVANWQRVPYSKAECCVKVQ